MVSTASGHLCGRLDFSEVRDDLRIPDRMRKWNARQVIAGLYTRPIFPVRNTSPKSAFAIHITPPITSTVTPD
jgi:hypothetical protein